MLRDFWFFVRALWREWRVLLTGGTIIAVITLWTLVGKKPPSQNVDWLIVGFTLILAAFLSWRSEWIKAGQWFIELDPYAIARTCSGLTELQTKERLRHYVGKRMKVTGKVSDIVNLDLSLPWRMFMIHMDIEGATVHCLVSRWNRSFQGFTALPNGSILTVSGEIYSVTCSFRSVSVGLSGCELIQVKFPDEQPATPTIP